MAQAAWTLSSGDLPLLQALRGLTFRETLCDGPDWVARFVCPFCRVSLSSTRAALLASLRRAKLHDSSVHGDRLHDTRMLSAKAIFAFEFTCEFERLC